jgi:hypothetical protein
MLLIEAKTKKKGRGFLRNSFVKKPAIKVSFLKFSETEESKPNMMLADKEKRQVFGPMMIPNRLIYRDKDQVKQDDNAQVYWTASTIEDERLRMMQDGRLYDITLDHSGKKADAVLIESWIVKHDNDWLYTQGMDKKDCPIGSLVAGYQVLSDSLWQDIQDGKFTGFSIEGEYDLEVKTPKKEREPGFKLAEEDEDDREVLSDEQATKALEYLKTKGQTEDELKNEGWEFVNEELGQVLQLAIESSPEEESFLDNNKYQVRYRYVGPRDDKNRIFCAEMMNYGRLFRKEDINYLSFRGENEMADTNYSIFNFKGSYGCRHHWERVILNKKTGKVVTNPSINISDTLATTTNPKPIHAEETEDIVEVMAQAMAELVVEMELADPKPGEDKETFIGRCISTVLKDGTTDDKDQAFAICKSKWNNK